MRSATEATGGARRCQTGLGSLDQQIPLHRREGREQAEREPASGRGCVDLLGQAHQPDTVAFEVLPEFDEVLHPPAEAAQRVDNDCVAGNGVLQHRVESGP